MEGDEDDLHDLVRSYLSDPEVGLRPGDPAEPRLNTWHYGFRPERLDVTEVERALKDVAAALRQRFSHADGPATFYCWYDGQAGQLGCSLASAGPDHLPFGANYTATREPGDVLVSMSSDPTPGFIPLDQLVDSTDDVVEDEPETLIPFSVWVAQVA